MGARTINFFAEWRINVCFRSTWQGAFVFLAGQSDSGAKGTELHTTQPVDFKKGSNRNISAIVDEMPFGIGILFSDDVDGL